MNSTMGKVARRIFTARVTRRLFNLWNGDKQQHKPQQDCHRKESCQNADRNSNKRPTSFPGTFVHDYLLIVFPPPSARWTKSSRHETNPALERINVTDRAVI
jgi:hypothetical protein